MSRRKKATLPPSQHSQRTNERIVKLLGALALLWCLFLGYRLFLAQVGAPAQGVTQPPALRTKVRPAVQKVLLDNAPATSLASLQQLLVFPCDVGVAGQGGLAQAAVERFQRMDSEQRAAVMFVCLPPLLSGGSRAAGCDLGAVRRELGERGVEGWRVLGQEQARGLLEALVYLRMLAEAAQDMYAVKPLLVHVFDEAGSARGGLGKAVSWVFGLAPSLSRRVALQFHRVAATSSDSGGDGASAAGKGKDGLSEEVADLLERTRFVTSVHELHGYLLLGAHQPR